MLILDKPYVSDFLLRTVENMKIPVLDYGHTVDVKKKKRLMLLTEDEFLNMAKAQNPLKLYCNSENSINWIIRNLPQTNIPKYIEFCKDKVMFRRMIKPLYPDFHFQEVDSADIGCLDVTALKKPFIIKPSVGFFSIGVYKVNSDDEWKEIEEHLRQDIRSAEGQYPDEVMNSSKFIIEECIDGDEFAIDAYYNSSGKPVILNILRHPFSSDSDVGDRIYYTSKKIILEYREKFQAVLESIGNIAGFSNFPVHVEVRIDRDGCVTPIEFNPMRFAGWCVTDLAYYAYGINVYDCFLNDKEPEWSEILTEKDDKAYSLVLIDIPKGFNPEKIKSFDYDAVSARFSKVLELRKINFLNYPVFAFMFIEVPVCSNELDMALKMDFSQFISTK